MSHYECMGLSMQQQPGIIQAFSKLLSEVRPKTIIELGTGSGGLTTFFGLYGRFSGCAVYSVDIFYPPSATFDLLCQLGVTLLLGSVFDEQCEMVCKLIKQSGLCLVLCDDGEKRREFNTFAQYLKPRDIIMAHDYWFNHRRFSEQFSGDGRCEISYSDIVESCDRYCLQPFMQDVFTPMLWVCQRKEIT